MYPWCSPISNLFSGLQSVQPDHKLVGSFKMGQVSVKLESGSTTWDVQSEIRPVHELDSLVSSQSPPCVV